MKFGKDFNNHLEETLPEWRDKFLSYKPLKKMIKKTHLNDDDDPTAWIGPPLDEDWFVRILNDELDKLNDFYMDTEEDFVIRLQELKERIERVRLSQNGAFTSESEFSDEMLEIRKAFVTIHGEMVLLKNYSSLNFAGLVKILKKYDKRTGGVLSLPFTQRALNQPFFSIEPLTRLVRECESNLELLFPLEAEVVESGTDEKTGGDKKNLETSSVREDSDDVYRSTLAAMKAIQGLRRASSTYNPLSLAQFFHGHDEDDTSCAVTTENSPAQNNRETDQESMHSDNNELKSRQKNNSED